VLAPQRCPHPVAGPRHVRHVGHRDPRPGERRAGQKARARRTPRRPRVAAASPVGTGGARPARLRSTPPGRRSNPSTSTLNCVATRCTSRSAPPALRQHGGGVGGPLRDEHPDQLVLGSRVGARVRRDRDADGQLSVSVQAGGEVAPGCRAARRVPAPTRGSRQRSPAPPRGAPARVRPGARPAAPARRTSVAPRRAPCRPRAARPRRRSSPAAPPPRGRRAGGRAPRDRTERTRGPRTGSAPARSVPASVVARAPPPRSTDRPTQERARGEPPAPPRARSGGR